MHGEMTTPTATRRDAETQSPKTNPPAAYQDEITWAPKRSRPTLSRVMSSADVKDCPVKHGVINFISGLISYARIANFNSKI
jgi:hypothetical protein